MLSDPDRKIYTLFGTEVNAAKATFDILQKHGRIPTIESAAKVGITGNGIQEGTNPDAIPADFLVDEDQNIVYAHYGIDAGDNISLDLVESFAHGQTVLSN